MVAGFFLYLAMSAPACMHASVRPSIYPSTKSGCLSLVAGVSRCDTSIHAGTKQGKNIELDAQSLPFMLPSFLFVLIQVPLAVLVVETFSPMHPSLTLSLAQPDLCYVVCCAFSCPQPHSRSSSPTIYPHLLDLLNIDLFVYSIAHLHLPSRSILLPHAHRQV